MQLACFPMQQGMKERASAETFRQELHIGPQWARRGPLAAIGHAGWMCQPGFPAAVCRALLPNVPRLDATAAKVARIPAGQLLVATS